MASGRACLKKGTMGLPRCGKGSRDKIGEELVCLNGRGLGILNGMELQQMMKH